MKAKPTCEQCGAPGASIFNDPGCYVALCSTCGAAEDFKEVRRLRAEQTPDTTRSPKEG